MRSQCVCPFINGPMVTVKLERHLLSYWMALKLMGGGGLKRGFHIFVTINLFSHGANIRPLFHPFSNFGLSVVNLELKLELSPEPQIRSPHGCLCLIAKSNMAALGHHFISKL